MKICSSRPEPTFPPVHWSSQPSVNTENLIKGSVWAHSHSKLRKQHFNSTMDLSTTLILAGLVLACLWFVFRKRNSNLPPGPTALPLIGNLPQLNRKQPFTSCVDVSYKWEKKSLTGKCVSIPVKQQVQCDFNRIKKILYFFFRSSVKPTALLWPCTWAGSAQYFWPGTRRWRRLWWTRLTTSRAEGRCHFWWFRKHTTHLWDHRHTTVKRIQLLQRKPIQCA